MNAPANILPPHLTRHAEAVRTFMPGVDGKELEMRARLLSARESATVALARGYCTVHSAGILNVMVGIATDAAYLPMPLDNLDQLVAAQRRLLSTVGILDEIAARGADERG